MYQVPVVALDIAHKLLVEDQVVVCKMNPVNAWAGPFIRCAELLGDTASRQFFAGT